MRVIWKFFRSIWDHFMFFQIRLSSHPRALILIWAGAIALSSVLTQSRGPSALGLFASLGIGLIALPTLQFLKNQMQAGTAGRVDFQVPPGLLDEVETAQQAVTDKPDGMVMVPRGPNPGPIMHSVAFDKGLRKPGQDWTIQTTDDSPTYARVIDHLRNRAPQWRSYGQTKFLDQLFTKQPLINENKIIFETPLDLAAKEITLGKSDYFVGMCTADLCLRTGFSIGGEHDAVLPARDRWGYQRLSDRLIAPALVNATTPASLHLGVDVVVVTRDNRMPLAVQGKHNLQSPNRIVPFATGSMDWEDIGDNTTLKSVVLSAARRELNEEWGGPDHNAAASRACKSAPLQVIGMYREMLRGGKPQFVVAGRVDIDFAHMVPDAAEVVRSRHPEAVPIVESLQDVQSVASQLANGGFEDLLGPSQALFGTFHCLKMAVEHDPKIMSDLLGLPEA